MATNEFKMNIWRAHPKACRFERAEKTLKETANAGGVKFCRPFTMANRAGWWIYSPVDIDILWKGDKEFEHKLHESYSNTDHELLASLLRPTNNTNFNIWCPPHTGRTKFTWGAVEPGLVQIWTGCILETPPGWCLHVRSPINFALKKLHVMEGILETDWMQYDLWLNLVIDVAGEWISLRKNDEIPLAQIVPIRRESIEENWEIGSDQFINRDTEEANRVFEYWVQYNDKKFCHGGYQHLSTTDPNLKKDGTTFHKERKKIMGTGNNMEPKPSEICPRPMAKRKKIPTQIIRRENDDKI